MEEATSAFKILTGTPMRNHRRKQEDNIDNIRIDI
jgi:hypothetical protein